MEIALTIFLILLVIVLVYGPSVIAILKGNIILGAIGLLLFAPVGWVGALLTAKPDSWWAKNRYDDAQRAKAIAKHGDPALKAAAAPAGAISTAAESSEDWKCGICGEVSATKVAAESHVRGSHPQAPVESSVAPSTGS